MRFALAGRPICFDMALTLSLESTFRKGDSVRATFSAIFSVLSNSGSPVLFVNSARSTVSASESLFSAHPRVDPSIDQGSHYHAANPPIDSHNFVAAIRMVRSRGFATATFVADGVVTGVYAAGF